MRDSPPSAAPAVRVRTTVRSAGLASAPYLYLYCYARSNAFPVKPHLFLPLSCALLLVHLQPPLQLTCRSETEQTPQLCRPRTASRLDEPPGPFICKQIGSDGDGFGGGCSSPWRLNIISNFHSHDSIILRCVRISRYIIVLKCPSSRTISNMYCQPPAHPDP